MKRYTILLLTFAVIHFYSCSVPDRQEDKGGKEPMNYLILNEDNSHFFRSRSADEMTVEGLETLVDHYVKGTEVRQLMFSPNAMCTSFASEVWDPIWHDQEDPAKIKNRWQSNALLLHQKGIDPYEVWIDYSRELGVSPWLSMRMNDIHGVDDTTSFMHSTFWKQNPQLRRVQGSFHSWPDRAFDYGQKAVREYHMALIRELFERYDFDGLELDWMRFGYHFRPGHEKEGIPLLTEFMTEVRQLADKYSIRRGHKIRIGVRVPSRPWTAKGLGMDAVTWAKKGLIDLLVVTPFWASMETDMPIEKWKEQLGDSPVDVAAGLELLIRPFPEAGVFLNDSGTVLGAASSLLYRGADHIYLFNYMDSETTVQNPDELRTILQNAGDIRTATSLPRRYVVTYSDTWAPGEKQTYALPARCSVDSSAMFKIHIGPRPEKGAVRVYIGLDEGGTPDTGLPGIRVNGQPCARSEAAPPAHMHPIVKSTAGFDVPLSAVKNGYNKIEVFPVNGNTVKIVWVEMDVIP